MQYLLDGDESDDSTRSLVESGAFSLGIGGVAGAGRVGR